MAAKRNPLKDLAKESASEAAPDANEPQKAMLDLTSFRISFARDVMMEYIRTALHRKEQLNFDAAAFAAVKSADELVAALTKA